MKEIKEKQESGAQVSTVAKKFVTKCPKCGHTMFSVEVIAYQDYDGETDEWLGCEVVETREDCEPYLCKNCGQTFRYEELNHEEVNAVPIRNQAKCKDKAPANSQKTSSIATTQDELAHYTACVFEPTDIVEIRQLPSGKSTWHQASKLTEAAESLLHDNQHSQHIYVGANPRRVRGGTKSKDVACTRCLFVDFDGITIDEAKKRWLDASLPTPTITIASGHGVHAYWRLSEPVLDMAIWSKLQKKLIALLDSDPAIHDPARIMRLPGFTNYKEPVAACRIIDDDQGRIYNLKSLLPLLNSVVTKSEERALQVANNFAALSKKQLNNNISPIKIAELTAAKWPAVTKGGRNCKAFQNSAFLLKNLGLTEEQALPILQQWNRKNRPPLPQYELRRALQNAKIYGRHPVEGKVRG